MNKQNDNPHMDHSFTQPDCLFDADAAKRNPIVETLRKVVTIEQLTPPQTFRLLK